MPTPGRLGPVLEFNLRRYDWCPKNLQDVVDQASVAFQTQVYLSELQITGVNHFQRTRIWTEEEMEAWLQTETMENDIDPGMDVKRLLRVVLPRRVLPPAFNPGEAPILAKGKRVHAFDGDGRSDTRELDFALRLFDCGHFYMKQSYNSSLASDTPNWYIFEGTWRRSARGFQLTMNFRYPRPRDTAQEFIVHGLPGQTSASLNYSGDEEESLKGFLPTMTNMESSCWAALHRRPDKSKALTNNQNKLGEDDEDEEQDEEVDEEEEKFNQAQKTELVQGLMKELNAEQQRELRSVLGENGLQTESFAGLSPGLRKALQRLQRRATVSQRRRDSALDGEPSWPMYLGLTLFVFVFFVFGYIWYEEQYGNILNDIDEDAYWKTEDFMPR